MNDEPFDELTPEERAVFESVSRSVAPPPACEEAIVVSLRERQLIRDGHPAHETLAPSFAVLLRRWLPRVTLAAAALGGTFVLGATYGRRTAPAEVPAAVQLDILPGLEEAEGELFKNENGELVLTAQLEAQGTRPDLALALAMDGKPPVGAGDSDALVGLSPGDADDAFSLRLALR